MGCTTKTNMKTLASNALRFAALSLFVAIAGCASTTHNADAEASANLPGSYRQLKIEVQSQESTTSGGGVWLGNGEVLTALHIFYLPPRVLKESDKIRIIFQGHSLPAKVVFHGDLEDYDLALLKIDSDKVPPRLEALVTPSVCSDVEPIGAPLYITAYDGVYPTWASPVGSRMHKGKTWSRSAIAIVSEGVSGSPVFDGRTSCLAGIVSRLHYSHSGDMADPKQVACASAALRMNNPESGVTCAITPQTIFSTSEAINEFLKEARAYERQHGN